VTCLLEYGISLQENRKDSRSIFISHSPFRTSPYPPLVRSRGTGTKKSASPTPSHLLLSLHGQLTQIRSVKPIQPPKMSSDASLPPQAPMTNGSHGEADASTPTSTTLREVCADLNARVTAFLAVPAEDETTAKTQEQTRIALGVIERALEEHRYVQYLPTLRSPVPPPPPS
jgi:hypothetical protein